MNDVQPGEAVPDVTAVRHVLRESLGYLYPAALRVAAATGVADHLVHGPLTAQQLADLTGVAAGHLRRVLRFLATRGLFREDDAGSYHLTPSADLLRSDSPLPLRWAVLLFTDELYWRPAGRLEDTVCKGSTVFEDIFGGQFFDQLARDEERARLFDVALATLSLTEQGGIVASYDFPETGTVVDVAGGLGGFLHTVLRANPGLRGVLFDREAVLRGHRLDDPALEGRWETAAGDFLTAVPPGGDIYVLKRIVHDKNSDECLRILRSCREAMSEQARLLVIDAVVPAADDSVSITLSDVLMMTVFEGRERTEDEFTELLATAGLKLTRVIPTPGTLSIIEAVAT